jgi:hypothetical protein
MVAARLGPGRVRGNARVAAFSRQVAMYMANQMGWSTTQIGKFYNGRDHSTVCYAIGHVKALRKVDSDVDRILAALVEEIGKRLESIESGLRPGGLGHSKSALSLLDERTLDAVAERIASRILSQLIPT